MVSALDFGKTRPHYLGGKIEFFPNAPLLSAINELNTGFLEKFRQLLGLVELSS